MKVTVNATTNNKIDVGQLFINDMGAVVLTISYNIEDNIYYNVIILSESMQGQSLYSDNSVTISGLIERLEEYSYVLFKGKIILEQ